MFVYLEWRRSRPSLKGMTDQSLPVFITGKRNGPSPLQLTDNEEKDFLFPDQKKKSIFYGFYVGQ